jgi:hypothetical protein
MAGRLTLSMSQSIYGKTMRTNFVAPARVSTLGSMTCGGLRNISGMTAYWMVLTKHRAEFGEDEERPNDFQS